MGQLKVFNILFALICAYANQNLYRLIVAKKILKSDFKFNLIDHLSLYNLNRKLKWKIYK